MSKMNKIFIIANIL